MVNGVLSTYSQTGVNSLSSQTKDSGRPEIEPRLRPGGGDKEPDKQVARSVASSEPLAEPGRFYAKA